MPSPIEVRLTQRNMQVMCVVVHEDESTESFPMRSLTMRGAEREATRRFEDGGYEPAERWTTVTNSAKGVEVVRKFRGGNTSD
jgi:hypothetical protein